MLESPLRKLNQSQVIIYKILIFTIGYAAVGLFVKWRGRELNLDLNFFIKEKGIGKKC